MAPLQPVAPSMAGSKRTVTSDLLVPVSQMLSPHSQHFQVEDKFRNKAKQTAYAILSAWG